MDKVDCVVVGAGVIGLAVGAAMARAGREVIVLEAGGHIGEWTSSRNSEVIHAGIYYPTGSLKADLCVRGKHMLYDYCRERGVAHRDIGKLIVASSAAEIGDLEAIIFRAAHNGVEDLRRMERAEIAAAEPALRCAAALFSPSTGIIDSHGLMLALKGELEDHGGAVAFHAPLDAAEIDNGFVLRIGGDHNGYRLRTDMLVNAAGLAATQVARRLDGLAPTHIPNAFYAKGNYFALSGVKAPFRHLIYPMPQAHGLGVHLTLDLAGQARFGPDVEWIDKADYDVDPRRADIFYAAIRDYWPKLPDQALVPAYSGIRPKISGRDAAASDFMLQDEVVHGVPRLVNLFGIESPGLTASLAIADHVCRVLAAG